jgi:hypothetical protein
LCGPRRHGLCAQLLPHLTIFLGLALAFFLRFARVFDSLYPLGLDSVLLFLDPLRFCLANVGSRYFYRLC